MLQISPEAQISSLADIEDSIRGSLIVIEAGVRIDSFVKIKPAGGMGDVHIGKNSYINSGVVIYSGNGVLIGSNVLIAANCTLAPTNHQYDDRNISISKQGFKASKGGIVIEDDVWIGANSVLLDGAILHQGVVIGAGSVVRGELQAYGVYAGNPLKLLKIRS